MAQGLPRATAQIKTKLFALFCTKKKSWGGNLTFKRNTNRRKEWILKVFIIRCLVLDIWLHGKNSFFFSFCFHLFCLFEDDSYKIVLSKSYYIKQADFFYKRIKMLLFIVRYLIYPKINFKVLQSKLAFKKCVLFLKQELVLYTVYTVISKIFPFAEGTMCFINTFTLFTYV